MTIYSLHQRHLDDIRDLEQLLIAAHRRLDQRDLARGITRYPTRPHPTQGASND